MDSTKWNLVDNNNVGNTGNPETSGVYLVCIDAVQRRWVTAAAYDSQSGSWSPRLELDKLDLYYLEAWAELPSPPIKPAKKD